jgi:hypothetical protein
MDLSNITAELTEFLDGEEMTGRQAALFVGFWMIATALFGILSYLIVFVIMGV